MSECGHIVNLDTGECVACGATLVKPVDLQRLLEAAKMADCACTVKERFSGHRRECFMPELSDSLKAFEVATHAEG